MKLKLKRSLIFIIMSVTFWSCSATSASSCTMILSGSVHGQLDPCG